MSVMKENIKLPAELKILCLALLLVLIPGISNAQRAKELSVYYLYTSFFNSSPAALYPVEEFPRGFGISLSSQVAKKLSVITGFSYSHKEKYLDAYIYGGPTSPYREFTNSKLTFLRLELGLTYPITDKRLSIRAQGKVVPVYYYGKYFQQIYYPSEILESKEKINDFSLGINLSFKIDFKLFERASVFIEPGSSYYFFGRIKDYQSYNILGGVSYHF